MKAGLNNLFLVILVGTLICILGCGKTVTLGSTSRDTAVVLADRYMQTYNPTLRTNGVSAAYYPESGWVISYNILKELDKSGRPKDGYVRTFYTLHVELDKQGQVRALVRTDP